MTQKLSSYLTLGISVVILVLSLLSIPGSPAVFGGTTNFDAMDVTDGYYVDGTQVINGSGVLTGSIASAGTLTIGSGGTAINKYQCYTNSSYNPAAIASSSAPASVAFLTPNATVGDIMFASLGTVTSTDLWRVDAKVTAGSGTSGATTTLYVYPGSLAGVDLSTTTAKVCIVN